MSAVKRVVVVGGGYGGVEAARWLAKRYRRRGDVTVTLIDRHPYHTLMTELHEVAGHRVEPDAVRVPYAKIFGASKVKVELDTVVSIDFEKQAVRSNTRVYEYDYLVLGTGAEPEFFGIPGISENAFTLWSYDDAMRLRHHLEGVFEKAVAERDRVLRQRMMTFVVAGAGFTGIEMAGELVQWRDAMCGKWLVPKTEVKIAVVEAQPDILPMLEEDLRGKVSWYLRNHGVELLTGTAITGAEPGVVRLKDGSSLETGTFIWTAGVSGGRFAESLDLAKGPFGKDPAHLNAADPRERNRKGRLLATDEVRSVDHPNVFPVGDNLWFMENGKPLPQIVETAVQTGAAAAHNIAADIDGEGGEEGKQGFARKFKSNYHGFMVSVGGKYAVSNAMGIKLSGFLAMAMKHIVNLHYLIGVAGINQCWEYIKHEFLDMQEGRSFLRGFASYKTRGYWLLPLRLWLGLMWVFEGINKIGAGWLSWKSGSQSGWMFSSGVVQSGADASVADALSGASVDAAGAVTDATTVADAAANAENTADYVFGEAARALSGIAESAADTLAVGAGTAANAENTADYVFGEAARTLSGIAEPAADTLVAEAVGAVDAVSAASEAGAEAGATASHEIWDMTKSIFDINGPVATWFRTTFMDGMAAHIPFQMFQLTVVTAEMLIGLALFGGLFTWWAAAASIVMCLVFTLSGMFAWNQVWFVFAGFILLGGGGRAFGLDCWVVPLFKKWWNGTKFARKRHWYLDGPSK
jgi:NADH dehydrogenase